MALRLERGSDPASWSEERSEGEGCMAVGLGEGSGRNSGRVLEGRGGGVDDDVVVPNRREGQRRKLKFLQKL